jgi:tripartite-type tricarboxylate transporter receptor subunit TctC
MAFNGSPFVRMLAASAVALSALALDAHAQAYPSKPVRIIEAGGTGGLPDTIARAIAQSISETLRQPFFVETRSGANGVVGSDACAKAAPDGYTLCVLSNGYLTMNKHLYANLPYDVQKDFTPIINIGFIGGLIIANPSLPANNIAELIQLARSKPGSINWASWGTGSFAHLTLALVETNAGVRFNHVPYKNPAGAVTAIISGESMVTQNNPRVVLPMIKAGKMKPLAVVGPKRFPTMLPDVPTFAESGFDYDFLRGSFGVLAPAGIPRPVVQVINAEVNKLLANPEFVEKRIAALGLDPAGGTPEEYGAFLKGDVQTAARVAKAANLKPE